METDQSKNEEKRMSEADHTPDHTQELIGQLIDRIKIINQQLRFLQVGQETIMERLKPSRPFTFWMSNGLLDVSFLGFNFSAKNIKKREYTGGLEGVNKIGPWVFCFSRFPRS